jgi:hypothetical protein
MMPLWFLLTYLAITFAAGFVIGGMFTMVIEESHTTKRRSR